jgi:predicted lipoprotein with Yx(FWY)xxD motif
VTRNNRHAVLTEDESIAPTPCAGTISGKSRESGIVFGFYLLGRGSILEVFMKMWFLPLLAALVYSSPVTAQSPFPLPIPERPTNFPLPIPTRPTQAGYVLKYGSFSSTTLAGKLQGSISKLLDGGLLALDDEGRVWPISQALSYVQSLPTHLVEGTGDSSLFSGLTARGEVVAQGVFYYNDLSGSGQYVEASTLVPTEASQGIVSVKHSSQGKWLALKSSGEVISWEVPGRTYYLPPTGNAAVPSYPVPEAALGGVVAISIAGEHCLALKVTGEVVAWGRVGSAGNSYGSVSEYVEASSILPPSAATGVVAIAAGPNHGLALKEDGSVVQWGKFFNYASATEVGPLPSALIGKVITSVSALGNVNAALTAEGDAYIWGKPYYSSEIVLLKIEGKLLLQVCLLDDIMGVVSVGLSFSDDEAFSDLVGFPLEKLAQLVAQKILAHTNNYGLATKPDLLSAVQQAAADGEQQGIASVQSQPNSYGLYDSTQYEANRITGVAQGKSEVTNNPTAYSLFTESSIMDMNLGSLMLKKGTNVSELDLELTIETKDSLLDNEWQVAERIARKVSMDGAQRQFLRVRADAPYVAPNVKVLAHPTLGNILTDGAGRVVYFFAADSPGGNPLFNGSSWPYVAVPEAPKADTGVTATLASSTFGKPGGPYLTVSGRPAYYYVGDSEAGQANGHGLGYVWWTVRADGVINQ